LGQGRVRRAGRCRSWRWPRAAGAACGLLIAVGAARAEDAQQPQQLRPPPATAPAPDYGRVSASTGVDFSSGSYGETSKTKIWYVPLTVRYERGSWEARVTVPYIRITGPGAVVGGFDGAVVEAATQGPVETHAGLGDVVASGSYRIDPPLPALPLVELTAKVKFPTASRQALLGTGEFDYAAQLDLTKTFGDFTPFADVGYRFIGSPPGSNLHDSVYVSGGLDWHATSWLSAGLIYDWRETASRRLGASQELTSYATFRIGRHLRIGPYEVAGFTQASPDFALGLQFTIRN
jgi:hypothetical protein